MMTHLPKRLRRSRAVYAAVLTTAMAVVLTVFMSSGSASADRPTPVPDVKAPPAAPTKASQIQNLDQVKTAIKAYYGDTPTPGTDPVTGQPATLHLASATGAYANEVAAIEARASRYLAIHSKRDVAHKAVVFDIDDTTLNTYNYEIYSNFVYNPTTNGAFVNSAAFPAVFGMPDLVNQAATEGYTIFFLTGRPESQRPGTTTNLANVGYPVVPPSQLILKDNTDSWLASCAPNCTTDQYKSLTRQHIESLGYDIVSNFGDQFSDLSGGFEDNTVKMPNPMYFLP
jgi:hypothetical protein